MKWVWETGMFFLLSTFPTVPTEAFLRLKFCTSLDSLRGASVVTHAPAWNTQPPGSVEARGGQTGFWRKETNYTLPLMPTHQSMHVHTHACTSSSIISSARVERGLYWPTSLPSLRGKRWATLNINSAREARYKKNLHRAHKECMLWTRTGPR